MKRIGNLYEKVTSLENLQLADQKARLGKGKSFGVKRHDRNKESNIMTLQTMLQTKSYRTSRYDVFTICERGKDRQIHRLPYFPDRICHHAVMNILEPIWVNLFTVDTFSCIKGRGIHAAVKRLKAGLMDLPGTQYCLKLDMRKYYPSIDQAILKQVVRRKIKDADLLWLLDEIIDSAESGVPIGNYLSQFFANLYLAYFDHWIKEVKGVKHYYRYADDMVILASNKEALHTLFGEIRDYLDVNLKLAIKANYQVFPVSVRGIDFVGYRFYHTHTLLRKSIKKRLFMKISRIRKKRAIEKRDIASHWGWLLHCNARNLENVVLKLTTMKSFSEFNIQPTKGGMKGTKIKIDRVLNRPITVHSFKLEESKFSKNKSGKCLHLQIELDNVMHVIFTGSDILIDMIGQVPQGALPFKTTIIREQEHFEFS